MSSIITIEFRLLINGGLVQVPGHEPTTSTSSDTLSKNMVGKFATIPLADALELIPGSRVVRDSLNDGTAGSQKWFVLPSGPAPAGNECPITCTEDWYKILQDHASPIEQNSQKFDYNSCQGYDFGLCDKKDYSNALDPMRRTNGNS